MENDIIKKVRTRQCFNIWAKRKLESPSTEEEAKRYGRHSKMLLIYAACLNSAMVDLENSLKEAGLLRHGVKRNFNRASLLIEKISSALYKGVAERISMDFCRIYNDAMDNSVSKIYDKILLKEPEKSYNVVLSLIRLTQKENNSIGRFKQQYITSLEVVPKLLSCGIKDYNLDVVIERALDEITLP